MNSDKIRDHIQNPRNIGEMEDANAIGEAEDLTSNDLIYIYLKVINNEILKISFQTFGSATALAASSILTELVKGKTFNEAMRITQNDIAQALNGLPEKKMKSCKLAIKGLHAAIKNYQENTL